MYCRNCGQKLAEGDKFCSSCGEKTILANESDKIEEIIHTAADETLPHKPETEPEGKASLFEPFDFKTFDLGIDLDSDPQPSESTQTEEKSFAPPTDDFDWNIHTFPGARPEKTEEIDFNWSMPLEESESALNKVRESKPEPAPVNKESAAIQEAPMEKSASSLEEELFGGLDSKTDEARKQSQQIDKFFTFNKKNEEFQKLLDQEYEKIKSGNILAEEMNTATVASEEKFASRTSDDPMEDLFASEGLVKGYEPKPVETDVLDRIEAAEAEKKAREEAARLIEEEKAKAKAEAEAKAKEEAEALAKAKADEEAARLRLEEEAKRTADARAAQEAAERERARAAAREEAEAAMKAAEAKAKMAREEAEAKLAQQAALMKAEAEAKAKAEAEAKARAEAEAKAREEARARAEAEAKAIAEAAAAAKAAEEAKAAEKMDPSNHISEMVRARETFFGQQDEELNSIEELRPEESIPEKTKAVDKAAILAGMATASQMVQRDREAAAAAESVVFSDADLASDSQTTTQPEEWPDFLGHLDEPEPEVQEIPEPVVDIFDELQDVSKPQEEPEYLSTAEELDEIPADLFSVEDLLGEESITPIAEETPVTQVSDETMIMTEESVADFLNAQAETEAPMDATMVFPSDFSPAEDINEALEDAAPTPQAPEFEDEEDYDEEEKGGKGRIVLKVCLVILILLLVMEIAGVVIKVAAPSSGAAKFIDSQLNKVIHLFTGDDAEYSVLAASEKVREEPIEDKTSLIEAEMGKNKDGNIQAVKYNKDLKFDADKKYDNSDLSLTQSLADVTWYKNAENKQIYYDQAIVGAMIAYNSQRVNLMNNNDTSVLNLMEKGTDLYKEVEKLKGKSIKETFKTLEIGEIRQAGSSYYVWVSEKVTDKENGVKNTKTTKKIYELKPEGETMKVAASYEI